MKQKQQLTYMLHLNTVRTMQILLLLQLKVCHSLLCKSVYLSNTGNAIKYEFLLAQENSYRQGKKELQGTRELLRHTI